jgi:hypothetical protein
MALDSARELYSAVVVLSLATGMVWLRVQSYGWYRGRKR